MTPGDYSRRFIDSGKLEKILIKTPGFYDGNLDRPERREQAAGNLLGSMTPDQWYRLARASRSETERAKGWLSRRWRAASIRQPGG